MSRSILRAKPIYFIVLFFAIACISRIFGFSFEQDHPTDITGIWMTESKESMIQVYKTNNKFYGKIFWLKFPNDPETGKAKLDKKNPDLKLRTRPILGLQIVNDFIYNASDKEWKDGTIYDPKSGSTYNCKASLTDHNTMKVRGYIGYAWMGLGRTEIWKKILN
jgi:uncharacterized protein (DUF2147 family)